ncbi:phosphocholine-specific phospholipase C [Nonomuraea sp. NPDC050536]|uniref:phosphocholine-specific phospholipase C n=1 Tax=Nonomuraea sp. NPDC050536 TaxID=3364366 RepID=UPI0037CB4CFE
MTEPAATRPIKRHIKAPEPPTTGAKNGRVTQGRIGVAEKVPGRRRGRLAAAHLVTHRRRPRGRPAGTSLASVKHIVILSQENRSFDHYFGASAGVRGLSDRNAIKVNGKSVFTQGPSNLRPFRMNWISQTPFCVGGFEMSWAPNHTMWHNGKVDQWLNYNDGVKMGYLGRHELSFYWELADAFTICDDYHCSAFTQTNPNRLYMFTGTNGVSLSGHPIVIDNSYNAGNRTLAWKTFPERLLEAGISWKFYQNGPLGDGNFDDNPLVWFKQYQTPGTELYNRGMQTVADIPAALRADVVNGTLPQVSWIVTRYEESEHPQAKPPAGEAFASRVIDALYQPFDGHPHGVWEDTVFIITYDENGGFYDHVPPPVPPSPASGSGSGSNVGVDGNGNVVGEIYQNVPTGAGWRVPLIAVSPWSTGGFVCSQTFDHTSLIRFIESWSQAIGRPVRETNISAWRRAVCGDLTSAFDFANPGGWPSAMPDPGPLGGAISTQCYTVTYPSNPAPATQEAGTKRARPLPWQPNVNGRTNTGEKRFYLDMTNTGTTAVTFTVLPNAIRTDGPWHYTVGAQTGTPFSDWFAKDDQFDLSLYGPNGFHRRFAGKISAPSIEVASKYAADASTITLTLTNLRTSAITVTVTDGAYATGGPWTLTVPASGSTQRAFTTDHGWYDLTVTTPADTAFARRLAGHIENGTAGITDPMRGTLAPISRAGWTVAYADSQETQAENAAAANVLDGVIGTFWHTQWSAATPGFPHEIQLDMKQTYACAGLEYLPRQDGGQNGTIKTYEIYVSADGATWGSPVATGSWASDTTVKQVVFAAPVSGRYVRLRALSEINGNPWASAAEINILSR